MAKSPKWKGVLVDREWLRERIRQGFAACAKGKLDEHIGALVNDIETYIVGELLLNTKEVMNGIKQQLDESAKHLEELAGGITEHQIKRRARQLGDDQ